MQATRHRNLLHSIIFRSLVCYSWVLGNYSRVPGSIIFRLVCSGRRAAGVPTPAPRPGLSPRTPNFAWFYIATFGAHASVVPKSWQRTWNALGRILCSPQGMTTNIAHDTGASCRRRPGNWQEFHRSGATGAKPMLLRYDKNFTLSHMIIPDTIRIKTSMSVVFGPFCGFGGV